MFDWLDARVPQLVATRELPSWPGGARALSGTVASLGTLGASSRLTLSGDGPVAVVPLELGGLLIVTHIGSSSEEGLSAHLDLLPVSGWTVLPDRFESRTTEFALFDATHTGRDLARKNERWVPVSLDQGNYEIETYAHWRPDAATHVHLVRMIRAAS